MTKQIFTENINGSEFKYQVEVINATTANIRQISYDLYIGDNARGIDNTLQLCDFSKHHHDNGHHVGFELFDDIISSVRREASAAGNEEMCDVISNFYKTAEVHTFDDYVNSSRYTRKVLSFIGASDKYEFQDTNNGRVIAKVTF